MAVTGKNTSFKWVDHISGDKEVGRTDIPEDVDKHGKIDGSNAEDLDVAFKHVDGIRFLNDRAALLVRLNVKRTGRGRPTVKRLTFLVCVKEV